MNLSIEVLLIFAIAAFYLQDSMLLLHLDEIVVEGSPRRWHVSVGSDIELMGRYLFLPNPLIPGHGLFRTHWGISGDSTAYDASANVNASRINLLRPVAWGCNILFVLLFLALPVLLLLYPYVPVLLVVLGGIYGVILGMTVVIWGRRNELELTSLQVFSMGAESVLCPPHAINLVRKICLRQAFATDPVGFATHVLNRKECNRLLARIKARIVLAVASQDDKTGPLKDLRQYRAYVEETLQ